MDYDYAFEMATSNIRFGAGATREVGMDLADLGIERVMVLTDSNLKNLPPVQTVLESLSKQNIKYSLFSDVRVEPTDTSLKEAINFGKSEPFDGFVAVGGGSTLDTAKAVNLYLSYPPADFLDYVNPPVGKGVPVPGPLRPLFAIPTTAGTGSETTGVVIFDFEEIHAKTLGSVAGSETVLDVSSEPLIKERRAGLEDKITAFDEGSKKITFKALRKPPYRSREGRYAVVNSLTPQVFDKPGEKLLAIKHDHQIVAFGGICFDPYSDEPNAGRIRHLYVLDAWRGKGCGRVLVTELTQPPHPFTKIRLRTDDAAAKFYERLGWVKCDAENATHELVF